MAYATAIPKAVAGAGEIRRFMQQRGFDCCDARNDVAAFHELGSSLIPCEVASVETLCAVQKRTTSSLYLRREAGQPTGFLAFFAFSDRGERAVAAGAFHGVRVDPEWVCEPSPATSLGYVWGFGGISKAACFAVIRTGRIMRDQFFPHLGVYARAATPDGRKVMEPLGYRPSPTDPGFYYSPPYSLTRLRAVS